MFYYNDKVTDSLKILMYMYVKQTYNRKKLKYFTFNIFPYSDFFIQP